MTDFRIVVDLVDIHDLLETNYSIDNAYKDDALRKQIRNLKTALESTGMKVRFERPALEYIWYDAVVMGFEVGDAEIARERWIRVVVEGLGGELVEGEKGLEEW